jgi:hypothetical protein
MPISEARKRANRKYNAKAYDRLEITVAKGRKDVIKAHAAKHDESLNSFVNRAIDETMGRESIPAGKDGAVSAQDDAPAAPKSAKPPEAGKGGQPKKTEPDLSAMGCPKPSWVKK